MKFGAVPVGEAVGGIVAHAIRQGGVTLKKGDLVKAAHVAALREAGLRSIVVAQLETGDVDENEAAYQVAAVVAGDNLTVEKPFTGRSNLFATCDGLLVIAQESVDRINAVDERVTFATLPPFRRVVAGEMVATVKIIPFAVPGAVLDKAVEAARVGTVLRIAPFRPLHLAVVSTMLPGLKPSVVTKTLRVMSERLEAAAASVVADIRVPHDAQALAAAIAEASAAADITVVFGASAITDRRDVIPSAIVAAGGIIKHFGMPVDPGNLLLLGELAGKPVLGAPGCARSPKENGFDWILDRLLAGIAVEAADIRALGVGGLLMEIVSRPQPRLGAGEDVAPLLETAGE